MTEYISKDQARDALLYLDDDLAFVPEDRIEEISNAWNDEIRRLPSADVAPVIYAKWKFVAGPNEDNNIQFMCDNCGAGDVHATNATVPYCWKCGARMGGEEDVPKKPVGEEYSNDRFSGGWDCSDEEYNYSAYVRDVLNAGR